MDKKLKHMKKLNLVIALVFCISIIHAQDNETGNNNQGEFKTIFGGKSVGGYGGIGFGYSTIDNRSALVFNARGGAILGHWLSLGIGGQGFINEPKYDNIINKDASLAGGYGGFYFEPIIFPNSGIHVSFPVLLGVGGVAYSSFTNNSDHHDYESDGDIETSRTFAVIEPAAELEFNFTKWLRIAAFVSYRYTTSIDWQVTHTDALNNFSTGLEFKFGKF
jgi:hypothetical protein